MRKLIAMLLCITLSQSCYVSIGPDDTAALENYRFAPEKVEDAYYKVGEALVQAWVGFLMFMTYVMLVDQGFDPSIALIVAYYVFSPPDDTALAADEQPFDFKDPLLAMENVTGSVLRALEDPSVTLPAGLEKEQVLQRVVETLYAAVATEEFGQKSPEIRAQALGALCTGALKSLTTVDFSNLTDAPLQIMTHAFNNLAAAGFTQPTAIGQGLGEILYAGIGHIDDSGQTDPDAIRAFALATMTLAMELANPLEFSIQGVGNILKPALSKAIQGLNDSGLTSDDIKAFTADLAAAAFQGLANAGVDSFALDLLQGDLDGAIAEGLGELGYDQAEIDEITGTAEDAVNDFLGNL